LLNEKGEFISDADGKEVLEIAENSDFIYADVNDLGKLINDDSYLQKHIDKILALPLVDVRPLKKPTLK
jgi:phosphomannomutase